MNCYNHIDQPAVGTCIDRGKGLCNKCAHKYSQPICDFCNLNRIHKEKSEMIKRWGIGMQYGWRALNSITPSMFIVLPIVGWFIYFVVKAVISGIIGFFITPIKIFQDIKRYLELKKTIKYIKKE